MKLIAWALRNTYYRNRMFDVSPRFKMRLFHTYPLSKLKGLEAMYLGNNKCVLF